MPDVSAIVPCRNAGESIGRCLSSILAQGGASMEVLVVDDGSFDDTARIVEDAAARDNRVRLVYRHSGGPRLGPGVCRNIGLDYARGRYVWFGDADDYALPGLLRECLGRCEATGAEVCCFKHVRQDARTGLFEPGERGLVPDMLLDPSAEVYDHTGTQNIFTMSGDEVWDKFYRRSFLGEIGARFPALANSVDCTFHIHTLARARRVVHVDRAMYVYRTRTPTSVQSALWRGEGLMDTLEAMRLACLSVDEIGSAELGRQLEEWVRAHADYVCRRCVLSEEFVDEFARFAAERGWAAGSMAVLEDMRRKRIREKIREIPLASPSDICYHSGVNQTTGGTT